MRWHAPWTALILLSSVACLVECLRGSELVLAAKAKAAEEKLNPTTEEIVVEVNDDGSNSTVVKPKSLLTGIPQKDYIYDPNLPRELNGHNLTNYPFYNALPKDIEFECDGLLDGFYASVPHRCQVYHHCLFGTRYDFLCANYTAFDQKTFICHFVSEVDCNNSPKYYIRNEELYKQATTTAAPTTKAPATTTTTTTTTEAPPRKSSGGRRRRPFRRRRPMYEYYYDDEDEMYDEDYYEDDAPPRKSNRRHQRPSGGRKQDEQTTTSTTTTTSTAPPPVDGPLTRAPLSVYAPRVPPKIKRPVPINEKSKYDYTTKAGSEPSPTSDPRLSEDEEYYDDEDEDYDLPPKRKDSGKTGRRRSQHSRNDRKRPSRYDEYEDEDEEMDERPRMKKRNRKDDMDDRGRTSSGKGKKVQRDEDAGVSERPGFDSGGRTGSRKRYPDSRSERRRPDRRPMKGRDYYEDEEGEDEDVSRYDKDRRRPIRPKQEKPRSRPKKLSTTPSTTTTTTKTTTTTTTTTTPKTTTSSASVEDEEYDDYEYEYDPVDEPTSPAPHRFSSTSGYKHLKSTVPAATEAPVKSKSYPTFRPRKPEVRKSPGNTETAGSQSNSRKQEEESGPRMTFRRPLPASAEDSPYKRPSRPEQRPSSPENNNNQRTRSREESTPVEPIIVKKPTQQPSTGAEGSPPYSNFRRSKPEQQDPKRPIDELYNRKSPARQDPPPTAPDNLKKFDSRPENVPQMNSGGSQTPYQAPSFFRRPVPPTGPSEPIISPPTGPDNLARRPGSQPPVSGPDVREQSFRKTIKPVPFTSPSAPELQRRPTGPDGISNTGGSFRRGRPTEKENKKPLEELAYPSRRPPTSSEPVTDIPQFKFRSHFSNTRPVVEDPEYFKPPKSAEFTAPGPSGIDGSTQRPASAYDIDEEYDVTLNDALQPSTLNPTIQFTRVKSRGYQSAVTHPSYRSVLVPSASQNYYSKTAVEDQGSFETVVLPATSRFTQNNYKARRPAEWYW